MRNCAKQSSRGKTGRHRRRDWEGSGSGQGPGRGRVGLEVVGEDVGVEGDPSPADILAVLPDAVAAGVVGRGPVGFIGLVDEGQHPLVVARGLPGAKGALPGLAEDLDRPLQGLVRNVDSGSSRYGRSPSLPVWVRCGSSSWGKSPSCIPRSVCSDSSPQTNVQVRWNRQDLAHAARTGSPER